jgi:hypothetical protein
VRPDPEGRSSGPGLATDSHGGLPSDELGHSMPIARTPPTKPITNGYEDLLELAFTTPTRPPLRLRSIVNKIISSNTDEFMGGGHYSDGATLARQMHDQKAQMKFVSIPGGARRRQVCRAWSGCPGRDRAVAMVIALGDG